jgi:hypothetical protein
MRILGGGTSAANLASSSIGVITWCVTPRRAYFARYVTRPSPGLTNFSRLPFAKGRADRGELRVRC